jgi:hypothetical protein
VPGAVVGFQLQQPLRARPELDALSADHDETWLLTRRPNATVSTHLWIRCPATPSHACNGAPRTHRPTAPTRATNTQTDSVNTPPLNLSPVTADRDVAIEWFETYPAAGIEGLVIKGGAQPYPADQRLWLKVKHRETVDVICGAVIGTRSSPQEVIAGLTIDGELRIVGRTTLLSQSVRRALAPWLARLAGKHSWPAQVSRTALPACGNTGRRNGELRALRRRHLDLSDTDHAVVKVRRMAARGFIGSPCALYQCPDIYTTRQSRLSTRSSRADLSV